MRLRLRAGHCLKWAEPESNALPESADPTTVYVNGRNLKSENVAKTVAISSADPRLIRLVERWDSLPHDVRDEIIRFVDHAVASSEIPDGQ